MLRIILIHTTSLYIYIVEIHHTTIYNTINHRADIIIGFMYQHPQWAVNLNPKGRLLNASISYRGSTVHVGLWWTDQARAGGFGDRFLLKFGYNPRSLALLTTRNHQLELVPTSTTSQLVLIWLPTSSSHQLVDYVDIFLMFLALGYQIRSASAGGLSLVR